MAVAPPDDDAAYFATFHTVCWRYTVNIHLCPQSVRCWRIHQSCVPSKWAGEIGWRKRLHQRNRWRSVSLHQSHFFPSPQFFSFSLPPERISLFVLAMVFWITFRRLRENILSGTMALLWQPNHLVKFGTFCCKWSVNFKKMKNIFRIPGIINFTVDAALLEQGHNHEQTRSESRKQFRKEETLLQRQMLRWLLLHNP